MNRDLSEIITCYATKSHAELSQLMVNKSKDNLISCLNDLLTVYMNDKNSSSLREFITVTVAGYKHNSAKLGYNGFKHSDEIGGKPINCEAKPKNIQTEGYEERKTKPRLNADGSFNDYTYKRLNKDIKENFNLLCSGFVDGELHYIIEFPFSVIAERMKDNLDSKFHGNIPEGVYLRSSSFNFSHIEKSPLLKVVYLNKEAIERNKKYFNRNFYNFLILQ
ncbi:MAG: hypothetical protein IJ213_08425 [Bacteroidales bacterium]|nr:hypothetical protein [Bacteroidales bacterium]